MASDPQTTNNIVAGEALKQSGGPFSNSSLNGTSVLYQSALGSSAGTTAAQIALLTTTGSSATFSFTATQNDAGSIGSQTASGTFAVVSTGRQLQRRPVAECYFQPNLFGRFDRVGAPPRQLHHRHNLPERLLHCFTGEGGCDQRQYDANESEHSGRGQVKTRTKPWLCLGAAVLSRSLTSSSRGGGRQPGPEGAAHARSS